MYLREIVSITRLNSKAIIILTTKLLQRFVVVWGMSSMRAGCITACLLWIAVGGCDNVKHPRSEGSYIQSSIDPRQLFYVAFQAKEWKEAREQGLKALTVTPGDPDLLQGTAVASARCGLKRDAADLLVEAAKAADFQPVSRVDLAVQALIDVGEVYGAIELLEQTLRQHPQNEELRWTLIGFLGEAQRPDLLPPHYQRLVRGRDFELSILLGFTDSSIRRHSTKTVDSLLERNPQDLRIGLGLAQSLVDDKDLQGAEAMLRKILEHHPDFAPAHALLGQVLIACGRENEIPQWMMAKCPKSVELGNYWLTLGDWGSHQNLNMEAARAYWEATRRDVNNGIAWTRLANTLQKIRATRHGDIPKERASLSQVKAAESALSFATSREVIEDCDQRFQDLLELREQLRRFSGSDQSSQRIATLIAQTLHQLGRNWEAEAWSAVASVLPQDKTSRLKTLRQDIIESLKTDRNWISKKGHSELDIDLSHLPLPEPIATFAGTERSRNLALPTSDDTRNLRLIDETEFRGLVLSHKSERSHIPSLIHSMGTGGASIDFDLDGWTDLMLAGAGGDMRVRNSDANVCLRNLNGELEDVSIETNTDDTGFCQGIAVGDFNEDGFPDVFLANIGANRLLKNNGDGTFSETTSPFVSDDRQWTTCGAFVDLDADGITDLVAVNYCDANAPIDQPCFEDEKLVACHPARFPAHHDQILQGDGRGHFQNMTSQWLGEIPYGRGLGVLAGALDSRTVSVLVANDMSANHYYTQKTPPETIVRESATIRGVAVDARTLAQASMGIASGDFDGDGDLDLFITGFAHEYNIYYEQVSPGSWRDETARNGLLQPSLMTVGFGTEAIDLDGDGIEELLVTNGHIGNFGEGNPPREQPFQLFRRSTSGRYASLDVSQWCDYLATPHIGRALWTIDVDRDGRSDIVITHENEPPCLLVNRTESDHHRLSLRLVGSSDVRDATGAVVRFECGGRKRVLWLLSGDGYMCSNERVLRVGLGNEKRVENLSVTWPNATVDEIGTLKGDHEYLIVQGTNNAFVMQSSQR